MNAPAGTGPTGRRRATAQAHGGGTAWLRAGGLVLLLNALFLATAVATARLPREPLRERVRDAFAAGVLTDRDWLAFDMRRGNHQYDECLILQMLTNEPGPLLAAAVGPRKHARDASYSDYCLTLQQLVVERADPAGFIDFPYTRYWHGYMPVTAGFLSVADLGSAKRVLHVLAYAATLLLLAAALRRTGMLRVVGVSTAIATMAVWGLPYFGQLFAHAPGDILVVLGLAALITGADRLRRQVLLVPFCAAFGALVVYLEFLTGQLPTAAALLFATTYAIGTGRTEEIAPRAAPDRTGIAEPNSGADLAAVARVRAGAWRLAVLALVAFAFGAGLTVLIKQALAAAVLGTAAISAFSGSLVRYMGPAPTGGFVPDVLRPFSELFRWGRVLTYNSPALAAILFGAAIVSWIAAAAVSVRAGLRHARGWTVASDVLALMFGAAIIIAWILLLQNHTYFHARFMVRMAVAPIALGAAALTWSLLATRTGAVMSTRKGAVPATRTAPGSGGDTQPVRSGRP
jgi:hypothetical protein